MFSKTIVAVPVLFAALLSNAADFVPSARTGAAIQQAIDAANAAGGGRVVLEKGTYPSGTIYLKSHVELHVPEGATILGNDTPDGYDDVDDYQQYALSVFLHGSIPRYYSIIYYVI